MIYVVFLLSATATGALLATALRAMGVEHPGILVATGIIGAGLQMLILIGWYLYHTRDQSRP